MQLALSGEPDLTECGHQTRGDFSGCCALVGRGSVRRAHDIGLITQRDRDLSAWLARLVGATVDQIRLRFGLGRTQVYRRLQVLHAYGLVRRHRLLAERPTLYAARGRRVRIAAFEHALAVTELGVARELAGAR